jgi:hypothetical protein
LNGGPHTCDRLVNQGRGHVDDAARFLPQHLIYGQLGHVKKTRERRRDQSSEVFGRVFGERLRNKNTGVVDQHVDAAKA